MLPGRNQPRSQSAQSLQGRPAALDKDPRKELAQRDAIEDLQGEQHPERRLPPRGFVLPQITAVDPEDIRNFSLGKASAFAVCPEVGWEKLGGQIYRTY